MPQKRDVLLTNALIRTVDPRDSVAEAVLLRDGRFAAVGSDSALRRLVSPNAEIVDLGQRTVVPGFIDAHNHLSIAAFAPDCVDCSTPPMSSLIEVLEAIERHCRRAPPGQWVRAMGFNFFHVRELRNPTRHELDEVAPHNPVFLIDASCHAGFVNSLALARVGIDEHSPDPAGGEIERDKLGVPTGTLYENAANPLHSHSWNEYADRDPDRAVDLLHSKMQEYLAAGITFVGDAMVTSKSAALYRKADSQGKLPFAVQMLHAADHFFDTHDLRRPDIIDRIKEPGSERLIGGTMKIFVDRAYPGPALDKVHHGCCAHTGVAFYPKAEVSRLAKRAAELGISTAIHGMGNCAVDTIMDAYESSRRGRSSDAVLRLEHAFVAEPRQAPRLASLGIDLVANPGLAWLWGEVFSHWRGEDQPHLRVLPVRSMLDAGVRVSLGSDHPCGTFNPLEIIWTAVTRVSSRGAPIDDQEAITPAEALRLYTINAAHASNRSEQEGSIECGKRANLVVLDRDIVTCPIDEIRRTKVERTYVDGECVYSVPAANAA